MGINNSLRNNIVLKEKIHDVLVYRDNIYLLVYVKGQGKKVFSNTGIYVDGVSVDEFSHAFVVENDELAILLKDGNVMKLGE